MNLKELAADSMVNPSVQEIPFRDAVILLIDDEPIVMDVLQAALEEQGYQHFIQVDDSRKALAAIHSHRPDLVLLDLKMPHVCGFDILAELRANPDTKFLSVIVLTSSNNSATKLRALELGATDFLAKPVDRSELVLRLKNTLTVKAYQDQLAYYDPLTQLPNRKLFLDRLDWAIKSAARESTQVAVLDVAVDRFGQVNDLLGTQAGDQLLVEVARRLMRSLRESDTVSRGSDEAGRVAHRDVARLSGDEFSVLLTGFNDGNHLVPVAERILQGIREPVIIDGREIFVTASIGIATYPNDAKETHLLMKQAGAATASAKDQGRNGYQFYSAEANVAAQRRISLEHQLRKVIERGELEVHYQPKIRTRSGRVEGMEALLRWNNPERQAYVPPYEFIPIAEESGMIGVIGEWVLHQACAQTAAWAKMGLTDLRISVNASAHQFRDDSFPDLLQRVVDSTGIDPTNVVVEITEGVLMGDRARIGDLLFKIKEIGASVSIDDFGTGYSSLSYLKCFPIDELKIDRSFIVDVPDEKDSSAIVTAILAMAGSLDLDVVAEGVETLEQVHFLKRLQCDYIQGYFFAKPMPADAFQEFCLAQLHQSQRKSP